MPEKVYKRLDGGFMPSKTSVENSIAPLVTEDTWSKSRKRKREHVYDQVSRIHKSPPDPTSAPQQRPGTELMQNGSQKQRQQLNGSDSLQPTSLPKFKSRGLSQQSSRPSNIIHRLQDRAKSLESTRKTLPIWSHATAIRGALRGKDTMLLVGETGSGKSTQVPQMLVDEPWCKPRPITIPQDMTIECGNPPNPVTASTDVLPRTVTVGGCIAITEPRRVAAITLARRVAEEMGTPLGSSSPASKVGYSVRFDNSTSPSTKIKFLTEGMLLQEMLRDPWLKAYSAVVVDEVHERGVNVDLILGFLRGMIAGNYEGRGGIPLKVAVMSATAEMESLGAFFEEGYGREGVNEVLGNKEDQGRGTNGLEHRNEHQDKAESEWSGLSSDEGDVIAIHSNGSAKASHDEVKKPPSRVPNRVATCYIEGRQHPVTIKYTPEPVQDIVEAALRTIFQIHYKEPMPGDVLVFLSGQETIESLENLVKEYALSMGPDVPKLLVLPLFAALPQAAQQRVFQPAPPKTRKIILSTNIAETSVTVSGVRFVIDCGKAKIKQFRTRIGLDSLLVKPISKSAAIQRKGRAGREAPGQCYRLYTEQDYHTLQQSNTPEILRCDLSHAILTMKARGVDDIVDFPFLDRPPREALEKALLQLFQLGALTESGAISEIGLQMAKLPLTVTLGRALIAAAEHELDCVAEVIDIISCLSVENVFLNLTSEEKKEEAEVARRELYRREGDHLTLLTTAQAYASEHTDRKAWAERRFVSHRAMQAVMDVRKQLRAQCQRAKMLDLTQNQEPSVITPELAVSILKCFLKGFASNTARLFPDGSYKTMIGNQTVAIHPSSGLFGKKIEAIMYNEFVFTTRSYARGVSAVQMDWVAEALGV
ncbi:MAG: Putative ATP-dependent RNA helicase dhr2 [Alectoria sarmentosa]|nr:MAG: Putative ATP-dependent RNA helicase dhr2 [Alectoria sarmentosa]